MSDSPVQTPASTGLFSLDGSSLDDVILQRSGSGVLVYLVPEDATLKLAKLPPWVPDFLEGSSGYSVEVAIAPAGVEPYSMLFFRGGRLLRSVGDAAALPLGAVLEFVFDYDNPAVEVMKYFTRPEPKSC